MGKKTIKWNVEFSIDGIEAKTEEEAIRKAKYMVWKDYGLRNAESFDDNCDLCGTPESRHFVVKGEFNGLYCESCRNDIMGDDE